ncbi:uncharacterized protein TNCV_4164951 [Trichonephila clavipes]|nr:uncharacterized protein TNCV_4164951 [Trichonephila clavipes]
MHCRYFKTASATSPRCWSQLSFLTFRAWQQPQFNKIMRDHTRHALSKGSSSITRLNCFPISGSFAHRKHVVHGCSTIDPDYTPSCLTRSTLAMCGSCLWSAVSQEHIQSLFESMPRRAAAVTSNNGGSSGY